MRSARTKERMNTQDEIRKRYSNHCLPPDLETAENKVAELLGEMAMINAQLAQANMIIEDRSIPLRDPQKAERREWRYRAIFAKGAMERELAFLKNWIRQERLKNRQFADGSVASADDPESLLAGSRKVLINLSKDFELKPDEQTLLDMINAYLGIQ